MGRAKPIMIQGTMSNAGKSLLAAGLCRVLSQDGLRVTPFKSQNMALNSGVTADGLEMGRAQIMQAEACGIAPDVRMNPILLKPESGHRSQLIVAGKEQGAFAARDYFARKKTLMPQILEAFDSLAVENDVIIIEGAGSPAEINLAENDIVNMGLARAVSSPVLLAGDIDPGGVFAQLYGTVALLAPEDRALLRGLVVNKFRGDVEILRPGLAPLARRHRRRRRAPSASVELHRLRPAFARARRGRALRFLDDRSGPARPGGAPRLEDHARRRALACG